MKLPLIRSESSIKKMSAENVKKAFLELQNAFEDITDNRLFLCHSCGEFIRADFFYSHDDYATGKFPICKECLLKAATDYDEKKKIRVDNKEKTMRVFRQMDIPFVEDIYEKCLDKIKADKTSRGQTAFQQLISVVNSLPAYRKMRWADSKFSNSDQTIIEEANSKRKPRIEMRKIFGTGFTDSDYLFLQDQYDDWRARTQVDSKSQETYVMQICLQLLEIDKDRKAGRDVTNKLKTLDTLMNSAKLQPKQNVNNAATDSLSFGQLIEKFENERPIPEPDEEFKDINKIGKLIRIFFTGHLSKALGLKNSYSEEYEEEMKKYTVAPPQAQDGDSSDTYQQIFGSDEG